MDKIEPETTESVAAFLHALDTYVLARKLAGWAVARLLAEQSADEPISVSPQSPSE